MKQWIDVEEYNELSEVQKQNLLNWWKPNRGDRFYYLNRNLVLIVEAASDEGIESCGELINKTRCIPLLSIGQMIQIIKDKCNSPLQFVYDLDEQHGEKYWFISEFLNRSNMVSSPIIHPDLCSALWLAVKHVL